MIHVTALVRLKPGMLAPALDLYRVLVPQVLANEPGCLEYAPTIDCEQLAENQESDADMIVVVERWKSVEDFKAHLLGPPHVLEFRAAALHCLEKITLKITCDAL